MVVHKRLIIILICVTLILSSCGGSSPTPTPVAFPISNNGLHMLVDRGNLTPPEIARTLELKPHKSYEDLVDLGTSYIWMGEYIEASEAYDVAGMQASTKSQLVGVLYNKAVALAYAGDMQDAIKTTEYLVKIAPSNIEVAWLRYALYRYSGNKFGMDVAADQLITLDPSLSGNEILDPIDIALIVLTTIVLIQSATVITIYALTPPSDRSIVVDNIMKVYDDTENGVFDTVNTYGRILVETLEATK